MTLVSIRNSFTGGEISPALYGRTDLGKWENGCSTLRNFFVNYRGGASSRAGLAYVGQCKQLGTAAPPRDIPFQFNINQGYVLEFGDQYMRVKFRGAYVTETTKTITGATQANPAVLTITSHGYSVGDWVFISGMGGMTNLDGLTWIVNTVPDANHITLTDLFGNVVDSTSFSAYTSGGTSARIYTTVSPYAAVDLPFLKFAQDANSMSLTCVNQDTFTEYPPYDLNRVTNTNWVFTLTTFASSIQSPTGLSVTALSSTTVTTFYSYVVTAIDVDTGEESVASIAAFVQNNDISVFAGSNSLSWTAVPNASSYNVYAATPCYGQAVPIGVLYGFIGSSIGTNFIDTNIIIDFTKVPPVHTDPFARGTIPSVTITNGSAGYNQGTIGYTISTSTGTGFAGTPIVGAGGTVVSFLITNTGKNYQTGDTITITGGAGATQASGSFSFSANPTNNTTIGLNGVTWTFSTTAGANKTVIGASLAATLTQLISDLNASADPNISVATYSASTGLLIIVYDTPGTGGNLYTLVNGTSGAVRSGPTLTGGTNVGSATAVLVIGPQTGTYPSVVSYYQQRRVYGNTLNNPDTYFFSQPGAFSNFDKSVPTTDSDSIVGAPWAQQVNGIQFMQPMTNGLIILTGNGAWNLNGGNNAAITPSDQTATSQAYNGCSPILPPVVVNYDILYVQAKGSIVRDLSYNFFVNVFTGTDITILSSHLFTYHQLRQWAYAEEPYKLIWAVRDDGALLSLTYLKEQDVYSWARHDTNGFFVGVCSITEPPVDAVYCIVKRFIQGNWRYYSERMDNRNWQNAEDCFCVDAGLSYPMTFPNATLTPAAADGTRNISSVNLINGGSGYTSPTVTAIDATGSGTGATFSVTVAGGVITAITPLTQGQNYIVGQTVLQIIDSTGSGAIAQPVITNIVQFTASSSVFTSNNVGNVIRIGNSNALITDSGVTSDGGGRAIITSFVSGTQVMANIVQPITAVVLDNPLVMPVPAIAGQWSVSVPTMSVRGLNHLEGQTVAILADGSVIPDQVVTNGSVSLPQSYSAITVGLPYICQLQTLYLQPAGEPTIQGKRKDIYNITVRCESTRGISLGANQPDQSTQPNNATLPWVDMQEIKERNALVNAGSAIPLFTGDYPEKDIGGQWNTKGQVAIQQIYPLPANILAIVTNFMVGDTSDPHP